LPLKRANKDLNKEKINWKWAQKDTEKKAIIETNKGKLNHKRINLEWSKDWKGSAYRTIQ